MYAVIETGGKQYRVELNAELHVELTGATPGSEISFDRVLLVRTPDKTEVGTPVVAGAKVTALVVGQFIVRNAEKAESVPLEIITPGPLVSLENKNTLDAMFYLADPTHCLV